jgi:glucose/arabinose dehydrogenase
MKNYLQTKLFSKHAAPVIITVIPLLAVFMVILPSYTKHKKTDSPASITVKALQIADGIQAPVALAFPGNGDVWIAEQTGKIKVVKNGKLSNEPFLDVAAKMVRVNGSYDERGLLGLVLHPKFSSNKKFYIFYSAPGSGKVDNKGVLAEYKLLPNSDKADPNSGRVIFTVDEPESNHNGGCLQFGRDGYLYVTLGDGGGAGDRHGEFGNGQKMDTWLGKILRIDVNTDKGYRVPADNPFVNRTDVKPEIWAYGLRNPWRFSFDKASGQLFAGDVGQDNWEEVDVVEKGANYGWRITEGNHCFNPSSGCVVKGISMPIFDYSHHEGICVIGGYVYNGQQLPALKSKYIFADWTGPVFYLQKSGSTWLRGKIALQNYPENLKITGFGEDPAGEVYILTNPDTGPGNTKGSVYKIVKN